MTVILSLILVIGLAMITVLILKKIQNNPMAEKLRSKFNASSGDHFHIMAHHALDENHKFFHIRYFEQEYKILASKTHHTIIHDMPTTIVHHGDME